MKFSCKKVLPVVQYCRDDDRPNRVTVNVRYSSTENKNWIAAEFIKDYKLAGPNEDGELDYIPAAKLVPMYYNDVNQCWKFGYIDEMPIDLQKATQNEKILDIDSLPHTYSKKFRRS